TDHGETPWSVEDLEVLRIVERVAIGAVAVPLVAGEHVLVHLGVVLLPVGQVGPDEGGAVVGLLAPHRAFPSRSSSSSTSAAVTFADCQAFNRASSAANCSRVTACTSCSRGA